MRAEVPAALEILDWPRPSQLGGAFSMRIVFRSWPEPVAISGRYKIGVATPRDPLRAR